MERERSQLFPDLQIPPHIENPSSLESCTILPRTAFPSTNRPFVPQPDGGTFGSFQQLLRAANFGVLSASDYGSVTCGANPYLPHGGFSELPVDTVEDIVPEAVCDDGYSAGTESENDTPREVGSPDLFVEDNRSHITTEYDDYIVSITDCIGAEEFMLGRDFDYGDFAVGIDDTDLTDLDSENQIDSVCEEIDNVLVEKNTTNGAVISPSVLGGCGCSDPVPGYEISALYQEGVRMGFNKR